MRRPALLALLAVAGLAAAGCGNPSGDDFLVHRTGSIPGAKLTLRVIDDGHVSCDEGKPIQITSKQLIDARVLVTDLEDFTSAHRRLAARPGSIMQYTIGTADGTVHFADNSAGAPRVFARAQALIRTLAMGPCKLPT